MTYLLYLAAIVGGFMLLKWGGDYLVNGSVSVARIAHLSPMVIGLTIVGFGTSSPELLVSVLAAMEGNSGIAIGNVVGSNIANIGLILGVTGLICCIPSQKMMMIRDFPFMVLSVALLAIVGMRGTIERWHGLFALAMLTSFVIYQVRDSRRHPDPNAEASLAEFPQYNLLPALGIIVLSLVTLGLGAKVLIYGASGLAIDLGTLLGAERTEMDRLVGLTIVAVGTSLPELFASVIAARKGQTDMAIGNIIGSVTFNILCVIGAASAITPIENASEGFLDDYLVMVIISFLLYFLLMTQRKLSRWEGFVLLLCYITYLGWIAVGC
ncbi:MAG: calcium/sodium antiporter [Bacteroidaceae bacterium]|nr:calcium/sodium antiporter [Bacteroidaceae bacterium]